MGAPIPGFNFFQIIAFALMAWPVFVLWHDFVFEPYAGILAAALATMGALFALVVILFASPIVTLLALWGASEVWMTLRDLAGKISRKKP